jgi:hypothetical protein
MSPIEPYYDAEGDFVFDSVDGSTYIATEANLEAEQEEQAAYSQEEAAAEQNQEFLDRLNAQCELKESRLGRELTEAEFQKVMQHVDPFSLDVSAAYEKAYPTDRTSDVDERQELLREAMDDETAKQNAAEAGEQYAEESYE